MPPFERLRAELSDDAGVRVDRWFNVYRAFDYVGQALSGTALPRELLRARRSPRQVRSGIHEQMLRPWLPWPWGHANYWGDLRFQRFLARDVLGPTLTTPTASTTALPAGYAMSAANR